MAFATHSLAGFEGREILRRPDMCNVDTVDTVAWYAQESVRLEVEPWRCGKRVEIPQGATAAWVVADEGGTNWIVRYDAAPSSNRCVFALGAGEGRLPSGHDYTGYVSLLRGTNVLGVVDRHEVVVMGQAADGGSPLSPEGGAWGSLLARMAEAEADIAGIAGDLAANALAIAELEEAQAALEAATNHLAEGLAGTGSRIDSLWAECAGGFRWPDYFTVAGYEAGVLPGTLTNVAVSTQTVCNVVEETVESARLKGWRIDAEVIRQSDWGAGVVWKAVWGRRNGKDKTGSPVLVLSIDPTNLVIDGNVVRFAEGVESVPSDFAAVRGTLGDFAVEVELDFDPSKQSATSTVRRFAGPAPGSLLEAGWATVLAAASNAAPESAERRHVRTWPDGRDSGVDFVRAGWNTNCWAWGLADYSCVSYWCESAGPSGAFKPLTLVTPRHAIVADHFKPSPGSNVWWVGRSGAIYTNQVAAYRKVRGDLTVARLKTPLPTNDVGTAALPAAGWSDFVRGSTNGLGHLFGFPCVGLCADERAWLVSWTPAAYLGGKGGDDGSFRLSDSNSATASIPYFRARAVGGDSGSPVFWPIDGTNTVLLGCYLTPDGGPLPTKGEVDAAIAAWGDAERCREVDLGDGGWPEWPDPALPQPPGPGGG